MCTVMDSEEWLILALLYDAYFHSTPSAYMTGGGKMSVSGTKSVSSADTASGL